MSDNTYDYDCIVIGGGSAGLSFANTASKYNIKIALCDYVEPTAKNNSWGLGGTCLNVGCIPKKLMLQASSINNTFQNCNNFGYSIPNSPIIFDWKKLIGNIKDYIKSLNFKYRIELSKNKIKYYNSKAIFEDKHTLKLFNSNNTNSIITGNNIIIACGGRPKYLDIPGSIENCITSDDFFFLETPPDRTLIIGGGYISFEIAGILSQLGYEVTIMSRSNYLKEFDQEIVEKIIQDYLQMGVKFINKSVPLKITKSKDLKIVKYIDQFSNTKTSSYNTIIQAIGRESNIKNLNIESIGIIHNGNKIIVKNEKTNLDNIFALGDIIQLKNHSITNYAKELQPVAFKSGQLLAERLYNSKKLQMNYSNLPTVIFCPIEYASCGLSQESAEKYLEKNNIEIYISYSKNLNNILSDSEKSINDFFKIICLKSNKKIIGIHIYAKHASEIIQGFFYFLKKGFTIDDLINGIGIHPTVGENIFKLKEATNYDVLNVNC